MEGVKILIDAVVTWLKIEFTVYGYTLSLWSVIVWGILASFVLFCISKIFDFGD